MVLVHRKAASSGITPTNFDNSMPTPSNTVWDKSDDTAEPATLPLCAAARRCLARHPGLISTLPAPSAIATPLASPSSASTHDLEACMIERQNVQADISDVATLLTLAVAALSAVPISVAVTVENAYRYPVLWGVAYTSGTAALALSLLCLVVALAYPGVCAKRLLRRALTPFIALLAFLVMTSFAFLTLVCQPWILGAFAVGKG